MELKRLSPGYYETSDGHQIERHRRRGEIFWAITWPERHEPDVDRPTLAQAWAYVQTDPEGGN